MSTSAVPPQNLEAEEGMAAEPAPPLGAAPEDIAWAAGLFEGEGSFVPLRNDRFLVTIAMIDRDVLERFQSIMGGTLSRTNHRATQQVWRLDIRRADDVLRVAELMRPQLGIRRRARLDELVEAFKARIDEATRARTCANCGREFRPRFTANAERQLYCTRLCTSEAMNRRASARREATA